MLNQFRKLTAAICITALLAGTILPSTAMASRDGSFINSTDSEANNMTSPIMLDLVLLRPVGLATMIVSSVLFVVPVLPLTLMTRPSEIKKPFMVMVVDPARFVWSDPLGTH